MQLEQNQKRLYSNLMYGRNMLRLGTLLFCLNYAQQGGWGIGGIWKAVQTAFSGPEFKEIYQLLKQVNNFRNTHVAHVDALLSDEKEAWEAMYVWLKCLNKLATLVA